MADQRDRVAADVGHYAAVVKRHGMLIEGVFDQRVDVGRVHVEGETDLVFDVADACQPGNGRFGGGALAGVTAPRRSA
jgi:hypothetical protein